VNLEKFKLINLEQMELDVSNFSVVIYFRIICLAKVLEVERKGRMLLEIGLTLDGVMERKLILKRKQSNADIALSLEEEGFTG
jgi:hypothetical protein